MSAGVVLEHSTGVMLPCCRTEMNMAGDHPASYQIHASPTQDLLAALVLPSLLVILTVPFTILRVLLLGWNCPLARHTFPDTEEEEEDLQLSKASKSRNCLTVCCGVSGMMMFTNLLMLVVVVYIFIILQSATSPLTKDPSD